MSVAASAGRHANAAGEPILIYRLGSLGDTIVALPCFHRVAQRFPHSPRIVLTNVPVQSKAAPLESILGGSGLIDGVLSYPIGSRSVGALWTLRQQIRRLGARTLVYLTPARGLKALRRDLLFFQLCGLSRIVGAPNTADLQSNRLNAEGQVERECERLARCLAELGSPDVTDARSWDLVLRPDEQAAGRGLLGEMLGRPVLAINMGGKVLKNDWGVDHWSTLLPRLAASMAGWGLLIVGGPEDGERARQASALWPGPTVDATGRATPRVSAAALTHARIFVGHDSGPLHLAASVGVPCVGLFGDNNLPCKWHPPGDQHRSLHRMDGVRAISIADVEQAVSDIAQRLQPMPARPTFDSAVS